MVDVEHAPEVLKGLGRLLVLHGEHEVQERLVVHFALEGLVLFKYAVDEDLGQAFRVVGELVLLEHSVFVLVKLQVLVVDSQT